MVGPCLGFTERLRLISELNSVPPSTLELVAFRNGTENTHDDCRTEHGDEDSLNEDGVLDLPECRLLDPHFAIKDLPYEIASIVFCDPGLVFVAIFGSKTVE